jgi:hypothetical protein
VQPTFRHPSCRCQPRPADAADPGIVVECATNIEVNRTIDDIGYGEILADRVEPGYLFTAAIPDVGVAVRLEQAYVRNWRSGWDFRWSGGGNIDSCLPVGHALRPVCGGVSRRAEIN